VKASTKVHFGALCPVDDVLADPFLSRKIIQSFNYPGKCRRSYTIFSEATEPQKGIIKALQSKAKLLKFRFFCVKKKKLKRREKMLTSSHQQQNRTELCSTLKNYS